MRFVRIWAVRFLSLFHRRRLDARLDEELRFHLEMQARDHEAGGMSPESARRAARTALAADGPGWSVESLKEEVRARRGVPALETLGQDLRYALRMMRKSPAFTAVALLSLAFGVGTNCAIFSVVDALLLKTLPVNGAERLVVLEKSARGDPQPLFSYLAWRLLQQSAPVCSGVMAMTSDFTAVVRPLGGPAVAGGTGGGIGDAVETARAQLVSGNFFPTLGAGMAVGRWFTAEEDAVPGGHAVAVISYGYWQRRFGRDPGVVGRALRVNGLPVTGGAGPPAARGERGADERGAQRAVPARQGSKVRHRRVGAGKTGADGPATGARAGGARPVASAAAAHVAAAAADGGGRPGAADRLRQPGEPAAGARRPAAEGDGAATGHRRRPRPAAAPATDREPAAGGPGGRPGGGLRRLGQPAAAGTGPPANSRNLEIVGPAPAVPGRVGGGK
ncbi:MAG TPA: ABC transporter permease [Thermoanaerobaculia bacterium]|nr:ABC transporter permease [Thermoanaerobaculia bacterium]